MKKSFFCFDHLLLLMFIFWMFVFIVTSIYRTEYIPWFLCRFAWRLFYYSCSFVIRKKNESFWQKSHLLLLLLFNNNNNNSYEVRLYIVDMFRWNFNKYLTLSKKKNDKKWICFNVFSLTFAGDSWRAQIWFHITGAQINKNGFIFVANKPNVYPVTQESCEYPERNN